MSIPTPIAIQGYPPARMIRTLSPDSVPVISLDHPITVVIDLLDEATP